MLDQKKSGRIRVNRDEGLFNILAQRGGAYYGVSLLGMEATGKLQKVVQLINGSFPSWHGVGSITTHQILRVSNFYPFWYNHHS